MQIKISEIDKFITSKDFEASRGRPMKSNFLNILRAFLKTKSGIYYNATIEGYKTLMTRLTELIDTNILDSADWDHLPNNIDDIDKLWNFRECVLYASIFLGYNLLLSTNIVVIGKNKPRDNNKNNNDWLNNATISVLGSTGYSSDIDVNVKSLHSSLLISVIEDIWSLGFANDKWKIELYGDFATIGEYYIDTKHITTRGNMILLKYAGISFMRHENTKDFDLSILKNIYKWVVNLLNVIDDFPAYLTTIKENTIELKNRVPTRETYYEYLKEAENIATELRINKDTLTVEDKIDYFEKLIESLAVANFYRDENYLLITTFIHVVQILQSKTVYAKHSCDAIFSTFPDCSIGQIGYLCSAIENLGYFEQKLSHGDKCNIPAVKYAGRIIDALHNTIKLIVPKSINSELKINLIDEQLNVKKERGKIGNTDNSCTVNYDLRKIILDLTNVDSVF